MNEWHIIIHDMDRKGNDRVYEGSIETSVLSLCALELAAKR